MREIRINQNDCGQRLDKFLQKYMRQASKGFLYKMLRKKNIKLNGKRAEGREILKEGDMVAIYFSEETLQKFRGDRSGENYPVTDLNIIYEDENVLLLDKPSGMLSQKASSGDISLVEYMTGYLQKKGEWQPGGTFTPGICNRLDRNTSGIVIAGKSLIGLQKMSELLRERTVDKYYLTVVEGVMEKPEIIRGYLRKDVKTNRAGVFQQKGEGRSYIETGYEPLADNGTYTLLRIKLITGKTHQIRSHLSSIGHPLAGDVKYGGRRWQEAPGFLLHAGEIQFPHLTGTPAAESFRGLSGNRFAAPLPDYFRDTVKKLMGKEMM